MPLLTTLPLSPSDTTAPSRRTWPAVEPAGVLASEQADIELCRCYIGWCVRLAAYVVRMGHCSARL